MVNKILSKVDSIMCSRCYLCQQSLYRQKGKFGFCNSCLVLLEAPQWRCSNCGLSLKTDAHTCGQCLKNKPVFDQCCYGWSYQEPLTSLVKKLKYHANWQLGRQLSRLFSWQQYETLAALEVDAVVPVPMFYQRQQSRGANHANIIAQQLAFEFNWPLYLHAAYRQKSTHALFTLTKQEREDELKHAFCLHKLTPAKHIALIDDVITSRATSSEISKMLKAAGCERITVISLCRTQFSQS